MRYCQIGSGGSFASQFQNFTNLTLFFAQAGRDFLEFLIRLCALPPDITTTTNNNNNNGRQQQHQVETVGPNEIVTNSNLREMCDAILQLLAKSVPCVEGLLWPHMLDYVLIPEFYLAISAVVKSSAHLAAKKKQELVDSDFEFSYGDFKYITGESST